MSYGKKKMKIEKQELLKYLNKIKANTKIGLYELDVTEWESIFLPILKDQFDMDTRFVRIWAHYMDNGGDRPNHKHSSVTMLYYLEIPDGDVGKFVYEGGEIIPKAGDLYIFPENLEHKITPNNTNKTRWALASECEDEAKLFSEI